MPLRVGSECLPPHTRFLLFGEGVKAPPTLDERADGHEEPAPRRDPRETPMAYPKQWQSKVEIAADAPLGLKLWRLSNARGGTSGRPFIVGDLPEFIETESNSSPDCAEAVSLPVTINGQIAGERDTDYFCFTAEAGETITAEVAAARLGSPLETVVEILDIYGRPVRAEQFARRRSRRRVRAAG